MEDCKRSGKLQHCANLGSRGICLLLVVGLLTAVDGCTRAHYRRAADKEVNDILTEKDKHLPWKIEQYHPYPDPRARFADPTDPDHPPMPPDDPPAYELSPHPQAPGHAGVGRVEGTAYLEMIKIWDTENRGERKASEDAEKQSAEADAASRSGPMQTLFDEPLTAERQGFLLNLPQAVELGVINSRAYQSVREDLYLAALPVTLQRFSFVFQFAAIENAVRQWAGERSLEGRQNNWSLGSTLSVQKLFSTGALLTAAFANNTVFNFLNLGPRFTSVSTINLDLIQPLLRGGGKAVTLEPLTQTERNLVYNIRAFYRFREQFYQFIALGITPPGNLAAAAGVSATGSPISILAALGIASTDVSGGFVGYLPTLYRELDMAADRKLVRELEKAQRLYEGFQEGGLFSPLQLAQVTSQLLSGRNNVLADNQFVNNALDQMKLQLGIPVNLPLILDDAPARPVTRQMDRYYEILAEAEAANKLVEKQDTLPPEKLRGFLRQLFTTDTLVRNTEFQKKVLPSWDAWAKLSEKERQARVEKLSEERNRLLDLKTDLENKQQTLSRADANRLNTIEFELDLGGWRKNARPNEGLEPVLRQYEARPWAKLAKAEERRQAQSRSFRLVVYEVLSVLVWPRNDRFERVGENWPELPKAPLDDLDLLTADVDKAQQAAVQAALTNRVDLMNARAQVVDAWRQLRVTANALMGIFNVQYHLDSVTPKDGTRPLAFSPATTNQTLSLNAQLPLVRVAERNEYRTALINYQRARRSLMNLEDNIATTVRFDVRQLHLFAENYKIQQKLLESLYTQVENALEVIVSPVDPDSLKTSGTGGAANAAALTNQYLGALSGLNGAQANMYRIWLSYLATRMALYLDLERLPLDNRGVWIDESGKSLPCIPAGSATLGQPFSDSSQGRGSPAFECGPRVGVEFLPPAAPPRVE